MTVPAQGIGGNLSSGDCLIYTRSPFFLLFFFPFPSFFSSPMLFIPVILKLNSIVNKYDLFRCIL